MHAAGIIPSFARGGQVVDALAPPTGSSIVLRPEATGAWCYYDTEDGSSRWDAPDGSRELATIRVAPFDVEDEPPPTLPPTVKLGSLGAVPWVAIFQDSDDRVLLFSQITGAIRGAPWISLRTLAGRVFFANIVSGETRWAPPHLWMEAWVTRPSIGLTGVHRRDDDHDLFGRGSPYCRHLMPPALARLRVDGGAPYMNSTGLPQYPADSYDSARTHPACSSPVPLLDNGLPFGESDSSAVTYDLQRVAAALSPLAAEYPPGLGIEPSMRASEAERAAHRRNYQLGKTWHAITRRAAELRHNHRR